jgi:hypothetical protein
VPSRRSRAARPRRPADHGREFIREDVIKPTPTDLGIDPGQLSWEQSGERDGSIEVALPLSDRWSRGDWVLMRVTGDPEARILVFDRNEWECFLDGARNGEFDHAADLTRGSSQRGG